MKKKIKLHRINVFTDEWNAVLIYCSKEEAIQIVKILFPDINLGFEDMRGRTFTHRGTEPLIWINNSFSETKEQILLTAIHEACHMVKNIRNDIKNEEWFAETTEYVVKQIIKALKIKII